MGSGKTTVGRDIARRLSRPLVDSDDQVEDRTGRTVREIWTSEGEAEFRRLETDALAAALASPEPAVVAAAGGVVLSERNRELLRQAGTVVWLRGDPEVLAKRAGSGGHRPLLDEDPVAALRTMEAERRPRYESVADHVVDVTDLTPGEIADRIIGLAGDGDAR